MNTQLASFLSFLALCTACHDDLGRDLDPLDRGSDSDDELVHRQWVALGSPTNSTPRSASREIEVYITNPWDHPTTVQLINHSSYSGETMQKLLEPHETWVYTPDAHQVPDQVELNSTAQVAAVARVTWENAATGQSESLHNGTSTLATTQYCGEVSWKADHTRSTVDSHELTQRTIVSVANLSDESNTIEIEYYGDDDLMVGFTTHTLQPGQTLAESTSELLAKLPRNRLWSGAQAYLGSLKVTGEGPIAAVVQKINPDSGTAYNCTEGGARTFVAPEFKQRTRLEAAFDDHGRPLMNDRGQQLYEHIPVQWNVLSFQNLSDDFVTVDVTFRDHDSTYTKQCFIEPNARCPMNGIAGFPLDMPGPLPIEEAAPLDFVGSAEIRASDQIAVLNTTRIARTNADAYDIQRAGQIAVPPTSEAATRLVFPRAAMHQPSGSAYEYGHIMLTNPESTEGEVLPPYTNGTVLFYDHDGNEPRFSFDFSLPPEQSVWYNYKFARVPTESGPNIALLDVLGEDWEGSIIVQSDRPLQGVVQGVSGTIGQLNTPAVVVDTGRDELEEVTGVTGCDLAQAAGRMLEGNYGIFSGLSGTGSLLSGWLPGTNSGGVETVYDLKRFQATIAYWTGDTSTFGMSWDATGASVERYAGLIVGMDSVADWYGNGHTIQLTADVGPMTDWSGVAASVGISGSTFRNASSDGTPIPLNDPASYVGIAGGYGGSISFGTSLVPKIPIPSLPGAGFEGSISHTAGTSMPHPEAIRGAYDALKHGGFMAPGIDVYLVDAETGSDCLELDPNWPITNTHRKCVIEFGTDEDSTMRRTLMMLAGTCRLAGVGACTKLAPAFVPRFYAALAENGEEGWLDQHCEG